MAWKYHKKTAFIIVCDGMSDTPADGMVEWCRMELKLNELASCI